ncbi:MAG: AAA family ATPase [Bacteroides sp.]|nr:AAA family ATPase [Bacteroides sp.]
MRILAIRLKNLASIEGNFEIDFTREPLRSAGIFAITGPTGAGKSTILDALCLALYDKTPRFASTTEGAVVNDAGTNTVRQTDVKNILRRGTGEGFAEVLFEAVDGYCYLSRWYVYRSRRRADGSLQPQTIRVINQDTDQELQGTKTEILARLTQLTGLTYDQFTRTVLLAQNDFSTFLKSNEKSKAELLEKLTGTDIYSRISKEVYGRYKEATERYTRISEKLKGIEILSEEEILRLRNGQLLLHRSRQEATALLAVIGEKQRWYREKEVFEQELNKAENACQVLENKISEAQPRFILLQRIEQAEPVRSLVETVRNYACTCSLQQEQTAKLTADYQLVTLKLQESKTLFEKSAEDTKAYIRYKEELAPRLQQARVLDQQHASLLTHYKELEEVLITIRRERAGKEKEIETSGKNMEKYLSHLQKIYLSLPDSVPLSGDVPEEVLKQIVEGVQEYTTGAEAAAQLHIRQAEELNNFGVGKIAERQQELDRQRDKLLEQRLQAEKYQSLQKEVARLTTLLKEYGDHRMKLTGRIEQFTQQEHSKKEALALAKRLYDNARITLSENITHLRNNLRPDEPCPLCGSTTHPYQEEQSQINHLIHEIEKEYSLAEKEFREVEHTLVSLRRDLFNLQEQEAKVTEEQKNRTADIEHLLTVLSQKDSVESIENQLKEIEKESSGLVEKRRQYDHLNQQWLQRDAKLKETEELLKRINKGLNVCHISQVELDSLQQHYRLLFTREEEENRKISLLGQEIESVARQRKNLLEGEPVEAVERRVNAREKELIRHHEELRTDYEKMQKEFFRLQGEISQLSEELHRNQEQLRLAEEEVKQWITRWNRVNNASFSLEEVMELLSKSIEWVQQERTALAALLTGKATAHATRDERKQQYEKHLSAIHRPDPEKESLFLLSRLSEDQQERIRAIARELSLLQGKLYQDQQNRNQLNLLLADLQEKQLYAEKWGRLNELIGSASGDKFKVIAQGYTLKILILHANKHLSYLSGRYRLQQVGNTLALQVIDRDMCDEIRTVYSLSGGETFLISLALALGLSSLSGNNLKVESLFIDEGFGSLDSESLRMAMDALEQLQMQGRKIGVISHVAELRERIHTRVMVYRSANGRSRIEVR